VHDPDLARLFSEHAQPLYGFLAYRVGDPTVAEDLLGDTFERVVKSHGRFNARKGSEKTWIYTIALNCLRDHLRRTQAEGRALERSTPSEDHLQEHALEQVGESDELMRALDRLEAGEREVLALRYGSDLRLQDIAELTGLPSSTVQGRLYAGLRKLRDVLEPEAASPTRESRSA
jgi:RNA polymerase sigma factor (sigma-70 family)